MAARAVSFQDIQGRESENVEGSDRMRRTPIEQGVWIEAEGIISLRIFSRPFADMRVHLSTEVSWTKTLWTDSGARRFAD